jgi:parallel beta-helix repeat protein
LGQQRDDAKRKGGSEMRAFLLKTAIVAVGSWAFLALGADAALAQHVHCGQLLYSDTTLDSDLTDCPGNGVVIRADNITLDLNGHTIDGPDDPSLRLGSAIRNGGGFDGVTVKNGTVQEFRNGAYLVGTIGNTVQNLTVTATSYGAYLDGTTSSTVQDLAVTDTTYGAYLIGTTSSTVQNLTLDGTYYAIYLLSSEANRVQGNVVTDSPDVLSFGISLLGSAGNTISTSSRGTRLPTTPRTASTSGG